MATHLVTGAGSGIGAALTERLAARGDDLWLLARDAGRAAQLRQRFPGAQTLVGDLADPARLSWAFSHQSVPPQLDSLIHVAGVPCEQPQVVAAGGEPLGQRRADA